MAPARAASAHQATTPRGSPASARAKHDLFVVVARRLCSGRRAGARRFTALPKGFRAFDPPGHPEAAELCQRRIEERPRALGVTRLTAARAHEGLVVVHDGAQRAGALLVKDSAGLGKPV